MLTHCSLLYLTLRVSVTSWDKECIFLSLALHFNDDVTYIIFSRHIYLLTTMNVDSLFTDTHFRHSQRTSIQLIDEIAIHSLPLYITCCYTLAFDSDCS